MELLIALLIGTISSLVAAEIYMNCPRLGRWLINGAVLSVPEQQRGRFHEEWLAHLDETPGALAKLWHSLGCLRAARRVAKGVRAFKWMARRRHAVKLASLIARGEFKEAMYTWSLIDVCVDTLQDVIDRKNEANAADELVRNINALRRLYGYVDEPQDEDGPSSSR